MQSRQARWLLQALVAVGPSLYLLLPGLLDAQAIPGLATAGIYARIHGWWWISQENPPGLGFPGEGPGPQVELLGRLLAPLVPAVGAVPLVKGSMLLDLVLGLGMAAWFLRGLPGWTRAMGVAVFSASPAVITGIAAGRPDALRAWAALLPSRVRGPWGLPFGLIAGLLAPGFIPAALVILGMEMSALPGTWRERLRTRLWSVGATALMLVGGWPARVDPSPTWFQKVQLAPDTTEITSVYVGFSVVLALGLAWVGGGASRRWAAAGAAAWGLAALRLPVVPALLLALVPMLALVGGALALQHWRPAWQHAGAVLLGGMILGEGWKGSFFPLDRASLEVPAAVAAVGEGPVLDLPATRGSAQRALYFQIQHHQRIAADRAALVPAQVDEAVKTLGGGGCPDLRALGFSSVVVRREQQFRELKGLIECLGAPAVDDGRVALWRLGTRPEGL